jgi:hypothetical protein
MLRPFSRRPHNRVGLVSKVCCQFPVRGHHFSRRMNLLPVARRARNNLGSFLSCAADAFVVSAG